jgi:hypothetical protein
MIHFGRYSFIVSFLERERENFKVATSTSLQGHYSWIGRGEGAQFKPSTTGYICCLKL